MKPYKEIDEEAYSREYQRLNKGLTDLMFQKDEADKNALDKAKNISRIGKLREIAGEGMKPLTELDDGLFEAIVQKVVIKSKNRFKFWF